jgi:uncharacterized membrane protein YqaE (UPF0057 family)
MSPAHNMVLSCSVFINRLRPELALNKLGGGGLIVTAIFLVLLGAILRSGLIAWLINIIGLLLIALGVILGIIGVIYLVSGKTRRGY